MLEIVTLAEAKEHCRILDDYEDATLAIYLAAATEAVLTAADAWDGVGDPPARLKLAVLARVAEAFDMREQVPTALNEARLLHPFRTLSI